MAKKPTLTTITAGFASNTQLNNNFTAVRNAFDNTLSLDGSTPNAMGADIDLNGNDLINAGSVNTATLRIGGQVVNPSETVVVDSVAVKKEFETVTLLLADTGTYTNYAADDYLRVVDGGFVYKVASSGASDHHFTTAGGVKLYFLPDWRKTNVLTGLTVPFLNVSPSGVAPPKNHVFIRQETANRNDATSVQLQRIVTTDDGHVNPKALRALTQITAGGGDQIEWAISGEVENSDNTRTGAEGGTAVSGVALKKAANTGVMFGGHFQVKDETGSATVGGIVGAEINIQANGADTNGNRIGLDLVARTYASGTAGEFTAGLRVRNNNLVDGGKWTTAIVVQDGSQSTPNGVSIGNSPGTLTGYGIRDSGSKAVGVVLEGTYGSAALRLSTGSAIAMEVTANIKTSFASNVWGFYNGANERVGFDMTATPKVRVAGLGVVGERRTGWTAPTGTATRTSFDTLTVTTAQLAERVKGLIDDLITHGLIGA